MTFLSPVFLYGLGAALIPLLIHLLNRRRAVTVPFSNVALLRQLQQDRMRRVRIRQIILLIIRTLIVLMTVLAFARPALKGPLGAPGGAHVRTAAILLIDQSYGMDYRTPAGRLFDRARSRAQEALRLFDGQDRVSLLPFSDHPSAAPFADLSALGERLAGLRVTHRTPDLSPALEEAGRLLISAGEVHRELYLFTNLARPGWQKVPDSLASFAGTTVFVIPERPARPENLAITRLSVSSQVVTVGSPLTFEAEVWNAGEEPAREVPVRFTFGERRVDQTVIALQPGERRRLLFHATPEAAGRVGGVAEAGDDPLPLDNLRHVVVDVPGRVDALLVGETPEDTYYVERAFAASEKGALISVRSLTRGRLSDADLSRSDLTVLCGLSRLSPGQLTALRDRVSRGGGVLIFPGERTDLAYYNERLWPDLLPVRLTALRGTPGRPASSYRTLGELDRDHPLFHGLLPEKFEPPRFFASFEAQRPDTAPGADRFRVLARYGDGGTALCERRVGAGRVLLLTSAIDLRWTDLPLRGMFVPLLHRMAQYAVAHTPAFDAYSVGKTADRPASEDGETAEVLSPGGESRIVRPEVFGGDAVFRIGPLETPGVWRVRSGGRESDRFAVAVDAAKGADLNGVGEDRLRRIFSRARLGVVASNESLTEAVTRSRYGRELWRPLLILVLALMAAEMILGRSSAARKEEVG